MKRKLLVISASKSIRFLLHTVLNDRFSAVTAPDAGDAIYWLSQANLPVAIVVDMEADDNNDWELIDYLRTNELYKNIPMVVISAHQDEDFAARCMQYGIESTFRKPFNPLNLTKSLDQLIQTASLSKDLQLKAV